ncbi:MAG TPA: hypothetical protein VLA52_14265 [Thermohalobaculum sp.]|nr:hypothetical protein [Thermohalobaculum sp.]
MARRPTVERNRGFSGPMAGVIALAVMGIAEIAIIGVLIMLPVLEGNDLELWRIIACAVLLTLCSVVFLAVSFVNRDGRWRWRWAR